jgi:acyl-CoA thioesterase I
LPPKRALRPRGFALIWVLIRAVQCGEFGSEHVFLKLVATFAIAVASLGSALAPVVATERPLKIVALGDSLTAGYGLPATDAFPVKLAHALEAKGIKVQIVNAGVSGDTTAGGLARLEWSLPSDTDAVILELGANDAMRGIDPKITRDALAAILTKLKERGVAVLLCGMYAPPNMGADFGRAYHQMYPELARSYDAILYPFFLDGVAGHHELNQADGIHPTSKGVDLIVKEILPKVEELVARVKAGS